MRAGILAVLLLCACGGDDDGGVGPGPDAAVDAPPAPCDGVAGTFHSRSLMVDGEARFYFLHVPAQYDCSTAWPMLVDFHGTSGGTEPEISYKNDELVALADAEGFLAVRPRSRFSVEAGFGEIYRWDQNPGDLPRNVAFAHALVADLAARYHIDPGRVYASGFSSGSNMVAQFLPDEPRVFTGLAPIAGGVWYPPAAGSNPPDRIYATTGYRDYLWFSAADLLALLEQRGYPMDRVFLRESDMGHELYGWHFEELWAWLDRGQRPAEGTLAPGWARDPGFLWPSSLVELAAAADGGVVAAGADGALYRRETSGTWAETGRMPGITFAGVCLLPSGLGVAVGEQAAAVTDDHGATWTAGTPPPGLEEGFFDPAYVNGVACDEGSRVVAVGYWAGLVSDTSGTSWAAAALPTDFGVTAQAAGVTRSPGGTWLAMGYYDYVGRSTDGVSFSSIDTPNDREWYTAAAAHGSRWTLVGEGGAILLSLDDGLTWAEVPAPREDDLYAVAYADAQTGLAVGAHGAAHLTRDGGSSWTDVSSGLDVFLGDVVFLTPTTALAAGERGTVLVFTLP